MLTVYNRFLISERLLCCCTIVDEIRPVGFMSICFSFFVQNQNHISEVLQPTFVVNDFDVNFLHYLITFCIQKYFQSLSSSRIFGNQDSVCVQRMPVRFDIFGFFFSLLFSGMRVFPSKKLSVVMGQTIGVYVFLVNAAQISFIVVSFHLGTCFMKESTSNGAGIKTAPVSQ